METVTEFKRTHDELTTVTKANSQHAGVVTREFVAARTKDAKFGAQLAAACVSGFLKGLVAK